MVGLQDAVNEAAPYLKFLAVNSDFLLCIYLLWQMLLLDPVRQCYRTGYGTKN